MKRNLLLCFWFLAFGFIAFSQGNNGLGGGNGNGNGGVGQGNGNGNVPIDGGASLLVAGGIAYGIKKVRDSRKKASK